MEDPLSTDHDAAYQANNAWRIPTKAQFDALISSTNATAEWKAGWSPIASGGLLVTSKVNGISLFLTNGGYYDAGTLETDYGHYFWSSTPADGNYLWALSFPTYGIGMEGMNRREYGYSIRPVKN